VLIAINAGNQLKKGLQFAPERTDEVHRGLEFGDDAGAD
jgi:hypothetical protein